MVGGCARVIFGHGEAQTRQGERGGGPAHPQGVAVQQLPVEWPSHQHLPVGVVGGADLKRPPHVPRCQRERHLGGRRRASYVGLGGREGDPTIIKPEMPSEHLKMVQRGWMQGYMDTPQQPALVSRYQGGTKLVSCPPTGTQRRGKDQEGATGKWHHRPTCPLLPASGSRARTTATRRPTGLSSATLTAESEVMSNCGLLSFSSRTVMVTCGHGRVRAGPGNPGLSRLHPNLPPQIAGSTSRSRPAREWCGYLNPGAAAAEEEEGGRGRRKTASTRALRFACRR